ncbi:integrase core domain protein [Teladorsagia circumcincta]|uniref:RNA-directed DNA polymerase n=1 Tax=Teladorsagia circumcincta TaxID=45464 RepID=A0A2G9UMB8_TELCI|nr:integrase core domain protein [Teladorsagia circumcincta]
MPKPKDAAQVRSFLGLINYYGAFVPEMRQLRAPLDALLKKEASLDWNAAFERAKEVLASDLLLTHYNPNLLIVIAAGASDYGIGAIIVSDNGTKLTSVEFQHFCRKNGIQHVRSPPFQPQSNGQAERFVDTFKRSIGKMKNNGPTVDALHTFLFTYRSTPCTASPNGRSPAENFIGRRLRSTLDLLKPSRAPEARLDINMEMQFNRRHDTNRGSLSQMTLFSLATSAPNHPDGLLDAFYQGTAKRSTTC